MAVVHSYVRFSTIGQIDGDSLRRQSEAAAAWVKQHKHKMSDLTFQDLGKSSFRGKKQVSLNLFLKAIEEGKVQAGDILLVESVDRLSRRGIRPTQDLINSILNAGVDIAILTPVCKVYRANDQNDIGGAIELAAFAYQAYIYSKILSGRIKDWWTGARKVARETGKPIPAQRPMWVTKTAEGYVLDPVRAETIRHIFKRTIEGIGVPNLCRELNEKFPKLGRTSFNKTLLRQLIRTRVCLGEYQPHALDDNGKRQPVGDPIPGYYPAVIDEATWLAAQSAAANRTKEKGPNGDYVNLWVGLVHHAIDDCPCHIYSSVKVYADKTRKINRRLKSYRAIKNEKGSSTATIDVPQFERTILQTLSEVDLTDFGERRAKGSELDNLEAQLTRKETQVAKLKGKLETEDDVDFLIESIKILNREITELTQKVRSLKAVSNEDSPATYMERIRKAQAMTDSHENRQILREAIKRVIDRINVVPIKYGEHRSSPVATVVEIVFRNLSKRRMIVMAGGKSVTITSDGVQHYELGTVPNLHEFPSKAKLIKYCKEFVTASAMLSQGTGEITQAKHQ